MRKLVILSVTALLMGGVLSPSLLYADDFAGTAVKQDSSLIDPSIKPPQAEEALHSCTSEQVELFSCPLESKTFLALCLNKNTLITELVRVDSQGKKIRSPISDLKQYIDSARGSPTVLNGNTSEGIINIFIDANDDDISKPALTSAKGDATNTEFCSDLGFNTPPTMVKIKGELVSLNLYRLLEYGISKPLEEEPVWPRIEDLPNQHKHQKKNKIEQKQIEE